MAAGEIQLPKDSCEYNETTYSDGRKVAVKTDCGQSNCKMSASYVPPPEVDQDDGCKCVTT